MPSRRDCSQCIRAQARSKPHKRIQHPDSFTLSVDLSGRLSPGDDQHMKGCKYLLVGCYTYPVTRTGQSLLQVPGQPDQDEDHQLPDLDVELTDAEQAQVPEDPFPEEDEVMEEGDDQPAVKRARSMCMKHG